VLIIPVGRAPHAIEVSRITPDVVGHQQRPAEAVVFGLGDRPVRAEYALLPPALVVGVAGKSDIVPPEAVSLK